MDGRENPKSKGWQVVSEKLAEAIVKYETERWDFLKERVDEELEEKESKTGGYRQLFVSRKIPLSAQGNKVFLYVRPKSEPYFSSFYGAHAFSHWVVDNQGNILYGNGSDRFRMLRSISNGMRDIEDAQCFGGKGKCYLVRFSFKAGKHESVSCSTEDIVSGKVTKDCNP